MKAKKLMDSTGNRKVFNRAYRQYLDGKEGLCTYCSPHGGCNSKKKWYGGWKEDAKPVKYPNWKLVSKNCKQWIKKPMIIDVQPSRFNNGTIIEIKFKRNF